jgi:ABC-type multidrug transport system permease subunit
MRNTITIALHDLRLTFTDRGAVVWMFLLPIVFATFFGLVMGAGSSPADATASLTVVDLDDSVVSRSLIEDLVGEGVSVTELTPEERSTNPDIVRTLVIPEGFGEQVLAGEQQTLRLEKEPDTSAEAALVAQARVVAAIARTIGRLVIASADVEGNAAIPSDLFAAVDVSPDLVTVETRLAGRATEIPGGFAQSIPGNAVMFVMLIALTYGAASISAERISGNLRRLATAPVSRAEIVAGKIGGRFVVSFFQITILVIVGLIAHWTLGIFIGDHPFQLWLVLLLFAAVVAPLGVAIGGWIHDPDRAASTGVILTMVMAAFGGCWWPLEVVSKPLKMVALAFPTGWAMRTLHGVISFGQTLGEMGTNLMVLAGFAVVFGFLASRSLRVD